MRIGVIFLVVALMFIYLYISEYHAEYFDLFWPIFAHLFGILRDILLEILNAIVELFRAIMSMSGEAIASLLKSLFGLLVRTAEALDSQLRPILHKEII